VLGISVDPLLEPSRPNGDRSKLDTMPNLFKLPTLEIQILSSEWHGSTSNGYETQRDETSHDSRRSTLVMRPAGSRLKILRSAADPVQQHIDGFDLQRLCGSTSSLTAPFAPISPSSSATDVATAMRSCRTTSQPVTRMRPQISGGKARISFTISSFVLQAPSSARTRRSRRYIAARERDPGGYGIHQLLRLTFLAF